MQSFVQYAATCSNHKSIMKKRKTIMLLVTYGCNLNCTYCYEPKTTKVHITFEQAQNFLLQQIEEAEKKYDEFEVQFMGGEPLMEFQLIKKISEWLWTQSFTIPLTQIFAPTNGTLLTDQMKLWFSENKNKVCLGLSFDGNSIMQNTNRSNSYHSVDLHFFSTTWPRQNVKMTISPNTLKHLYDGITFLYSKGFDYITVDLAMGKHISWKDQHLKIFAEQLSQLSNYYLTHTSKPLVSLLGFNVTDVLQNHNLHKKCSCGEDLICIDCDGKIYACHLFAPISATKKMAEKSLSIDFTNYDFFINDNCRKCLLFSVCTCCYGMNFKNTGDVRQQDAFTCQAFKIQFLSACKLQLQIAERNGDLKKSKKIKEIIDNFSI